MLVLLNYRYSGEGGLKQFYWGNGFKISENLSLGVNIIIFVGKFKYFKVYGI
jgi:hypothetical protein